MNVYAYLCSKPTSLHDPLGLSCTNNSKDIYWIWTTDTKWIPVKPGESNDGDVDFIFVFEAPDVTKPLYKVTTNFDVTISDDGISGKYHWLQFNDFGSFLGGLCPVVAFGAQAVTGGWESATEHNIGYPPGVLVVANEFKGAILPEMWLSLTEEQQAEVTQFMNDNGELPDTIELAKSGRVQARSKVAATQPGASQD
jgi:hypothetical protein